jgi:type IV secretory pathway VirB2 component (pilin)
MKVIHVIHKLNELFTLKRSCFLANSPLKRSCLYAETLLLSIYTYIYLYKNTCSWALQVVNNIFKNDEINVTRRKFEMVKKAKLVLMKNIKLLALMLMYSNLAMAYSDPATKASNQMKNILFGSLGTSLAAMLIGATFIMAYVGKITWDRFIFVGFCSAGFLGSQSIVSLIQGWVS